MWCLSLFIRAEQCFWPETIIISFEDNESDESISFHRIISSLVVVVTFSELWGLMRARKCVVNVELFRHSDTSSCVPNHNKQTSERICYTQNIQAQREWSFPSFSICRSIEQIDKDWRGLICWWYESDCCVLPHIPPAPATAPVSLSRLHLSASVVSLISSWPRVLISLTQCL